ncbi:hypothetical protein OG439_08155 [Amycolatopsis sp. NBC_01307]|uniref:DUF7507 domain-containing protein n=1 Tax=Amycolatopsis sp. NBC_01307 TaxID=2903561 RepID=UPI002E159DBB|nr:hypothetical protein OG439_08155 [Amycolatopsis sp. NBC_01307]
MAERKSVSVTPKARFRVGWAKPAALLGTLAVAVYAVCAVGTPASPGYIALASHTPRTCDAGVGSTGDTYQVGSSDKAIQLVVSGANGGGSGDVGSDGQNGGGNGATVTATLVIPAGTLLRFIKASAQSGCHRGGSSGDGSGYGGGSSAVIDDATKEILVEAGGGGGGGNQNQGSTGGRGGNAGGPGGGSMGGTGFNSDALGGAGGGQCTAGSNGQGGNGEQASARAAGGGGGGGCSGGGGGGAGRSGGLVAGGNGGGGASSYVAPEFGSLNPSFLSNSPATSSVAYHRSGVSVTLTAALPATSPIQSGDKVTYTAVVRNVGDTTVSGVLVDPPANSQISVCEKFTGTVSDGSGLNTQLAPPSSYGAPDGERVECTYTRTVTQADIDGHSSYSGQITAKFTTPADDPITVSLVSNPTTTEITPAPGITLAAPVVVSNPPAGGFVAGSTMTFTLTTNNTGNTTLTGITGSVKLPVANPPAGGPAEVTLNCSTANILPAKSATCTTAAYTVTPEDVKKGSIAAKASAASAQKTSDVVDVPIALTQVTKFETTLTHVGPAAAKPRKDDTVAFTATLTNRGTATLKNAAVSLLACNQSAAVLEPGASVKCDVTYTITLNDMNAGGVSLTATGSAGDTNGTQLPQQNTPDTVTLAADPGLTADLVYTTSTPSTRKPAKDDVVHYAATVKNTGTVTLSTLTTKDTQTPAPATEIAFTCDQAKLDPDATATCSADYAITTDDISGGQLANTLLVSGKPPNGNAVSGTGTTTVALAQLAKLSSTIKVTDAGDTNFDGVVNTGDKPILEVAVTNSGNVPVSGVVPVVEANDATLDCSGPTDAIEPVGTFTCTPTYTVTKADVAAGSIRFAVTASGTDPGGNTVDTTSSVSRTTGADPVTSTTTTPPVDDTSVTTSPPTSATSDPASSASSSAAAVVTTTGPPAAAGAAATKSSGGSLPTTGSDVGGLLAICAMLVLVGGGLLLLVRPARRRRRG